MIIIPAIDLYQNKVVRLTRGDPAKVKIYSPDPLAVAKKWQAQGAKLLHIVDLEAALGEGDNLKIIRKILKTVKVKAEVGGGIRNIAQAKQLVSWGADRVMIGTRVLEESFLNRLIKSLGSQRIAAGIDVKNSCIAVEGWRKQTDFNGLDFIAYLSLKGIKRIIYTDISRDGTLKGVNLKILAKLAAFKELELIWSGGVSSLADLEKIKKQAPFLWGVIVGKALYEENFSLSQAHSKF